MISLSEKMMRGYDARLPKADGTQLGHYSTSVDGLCWWRFSKKKNTTAFKNLALSTTQQFLVMTGKAKHCSTHGEQFMMTARLMTVPGNNFEAGRPLDDSKSTWQ